jgi:hypothetical protein
MAASATRLACALALIAIVGSGCGSGTADVRTPTRAHRAPPAKASAPHQLLFALPKMGRLRASCKSLKTFRLKYTPNNEHGEQVTVSVDGKVAERSDSGRSLSFSVRGRPRPTTPAEGPVYVSPPIKLTSRVEVEPYESKAVTRFTLMRANDDSDDCIPRRASVTVASKLH